MKIKDAITYFLIGLLVFAGIRAGEAIFEREPTKLLVCVADNDGKVGHCKDFADFFGDEK